jgi:hypothetical protein
MQRSFAVVALAIAASAAAAPAGAFWPRSQLMACSEAASEADFQRLRCWELEGRVQVPMSFGPATAPYAGAPAKRQPWTEPRQGVVVRRLG